MNFSELGLKQPLLEALDKLNFETPTPIQEQAIPQLIDGENDFIGLAQTGTGKTGAFGLPMLERIDPNDFSTQGIIICPTRELCIQVTKDLKTFSAKLKKIQITAVYGGAGIVGQIQELKRGSQVVVATPGRLCDLIRRKAAKLENVSCAVLDEADEMLNMGFKEDLDFILDTVADYARIWLFSATMPKEVETITTKYLTDPAKVTIGSRNLAAENIEHKFFVMSERNRYQALRRILDATPDIYGLVFCRTRRDTQEIAEKLMGHGYRAEAIHGDLSQAQRDYVMRKFRQKNTRILVATDVAARGLDINGITHVINYSLPDDALVYTHRAGRTARAGKSGQSMILINPFEKYRIKDIERRLKIKFELGKIPTGQAICRNQLYAFAEEMVQTQTNCDEIRNSLPQIYDTFGAMSKEELIDLIISREFSRMLNAYRNAPDIDASSQLQKPRREYGKSRVGSGNGKFGRNKFSKKGFQGGRRNDADFDRFFISIGNLDHIKPGAIVRLVCDKAGIKSNMIGAIDIKREFSFFDVDKKAVQRVKNNMRQVSFDGKPIKVLPSTSKSKQKDGKRSSRKAS